MATVFENVQLSSLSENGESKAQYDSPVRIEVLSEEFSAQLNILNGTQTLDNIAVNKCVEFAKIGHKAAVVSTDKDSVMLTFPSSKDLKSFEVQLKDAAARKKNSVFSQRTDDASAEQYFQFYGYLSQQQNMMQDYIRTSTYQRAMLDNSSDFMDKVVLDVGAGSGILSFFAIQAGARKVYAAEASSMAVHCEALIKSNRLEDRIQVIPGRVEEINIPEEVDIIISEPMGYMLFNERMLETYLHAKKWLKPGGKMFPTQGDLHIAPFTDEALYMEQYSKANFWYQPAFHGVDLSSLREAAVKEYFRQPIVDTFDVRICLARTVKHTVDFQTADEKDLHNIDIPVSFIMLQSGNIHGLAFWFDVAFLGSQNTVWLSTSPTQPLTHWYQVRCLLEQPIFVKQGQTLQGKVVLRCNERQSYDVDIELYIPGTNTKASNTLDLKNPFFRYTGQQPQPPPGTEHTSPSDNYWLQTDPTAQVEVQPNVFNMSTLLNGGMGDGQTQQANVAPVNPGSIPAATIVNANSAAQQALQTRTSVGGGVSPVVFGAAQQSSGSNLARTYPNQRFDDLCPIPSQISHRADEPSYSWSEQSSGANSAQNYPISNQFMIGDYVVPGNMMMPSQGLSLNNYKSNSRGGK